MSVGESRSAKALHALLQARPDLGEALVAAIRAAKVDGIDSLQSFTSYINEKARLIPKDPDMINYTAPLYFISGHSDLLMNDIAYLDWTKGVIAEWGHFLDSPQSIAGLKSFYDDPKMKLEDFIVAPSGWLSFNQFFAREAKPGKRPIAGITDATTIVAPADGVYKGTKVITEDAMIVAKGITHRIIDLLKDSQFSNRFDGGLFTHSYQQVTDYHRFHVPFAGTIIEQKSIPGLVSMGVRRDEQGQYSFTDGEGFQFRQQRGLIVLETKTIGYVAILPIGMGHVGSVELVSDAGATLHKGELFGFFQFGGSDVIVLFEKDTVEITAETGRHYLQGQAIGQAIA